MVAAAFAAVGHELTYRVRVDGSDTPLFEDMAIGLGAALGLVAALIWCHLTVRAEQMSAGTARPVRWATLLALAATVVLHVSLMYLQAFLRNTPAQGGGLIFGAIFGIPAALISASVLGAVGYRLLIGSCR